MKQRSVFISLVLVFTLSTIPTLAVETAQRISDREIVERLTRLEEGQKAILREMDKRFEAMDKRFEAMDKRFEAMDKRFEEVNDRFEQLNNLVIGILASFAALVAAIIGFAIWDRMSFLSRAREQAKEVHQGMNKEDREQLEITSQQVRSILGALRGLAEKSPDVRDVLQQAHLL